MNKTYHVISILLFSALILFGTPLRAAEEDAVDCTANSGRTLCLNMNRAGAYVQSCQGASCQVLFHNYVQALDKFTDEYLDNFFPTDRFAWSLGVMATRLSDKICGYHLEGESNAIGVIVIAENRALEQLKVIQEQASIESVKTCVKVVR